ncbi:MAG: hypothetical protein GY798_14940 [Hyphomicrobiales bacterium]|nr:hypothetical protein [Hyphomicrobiales bacterium]
MHTTLAFAAVFAASSLVPGLALAHTSLADHGHPHGAAHAYLSVEALAFLAMLALVAGAISYAVGSRRGGRR